MLSHLFLAFQQSWCDLIPLRLHQKLLDLAVWSALKVKPQYLDTILEALKPHILPSHLVISIAAGIRVASLEAALPEGTRVVSSCSQKLSYKCHLSAWL